MYTTLFESGTARLLSWSCDGRHRDWGEVEVAERPEIAVSLGGVFVREHGSRELLATPLTAAFANRGDEYRVRHPVHGGDRGVAVLLSDRALEGIARTGHLAWSPEPRLPGAVGQISPRLGLRIRVLLHRPGAAERLELEELVSDIAAEALGHTRQVARTGRVPTGNRRAAAVARGLEFIAANFRARITVEDVARAAAYSAFHFSRIFRRETGSSIHRYVLAMRLREAGRRLLEGEENLSALAYELGFSSHSHLTSAFRREYARAPSELRRYPANFLTTARDADGRPTSENPARR